MSDGTIERFRLPTETEWYYVASCGMAEKYQTPTDIVYMNKRGPLNTVAINNTLYENEFGVVGMLGNINEWTSSKATIVKAKNSKIVMKYRIHVELLRVVHLLQNCL